MSMHIPEIPQKYRLPVVVGIIAILGFAAYTTYDALKPLPVYSNMETRFFSFTYPRVYDAREYAPGVVSIGHKGQEGIDPLVEIVRYQSDPDVAFPASYDAFLDKQAKALCGGDSPEESITCTSVKREDYTSPTGIPGQMLNLTLVRKNLKTGTTTTATYGPLYALGTTAPATDGRPFRYSMILIYPAIPAFLSSTTDAALLESVLNTLKRPN